MKELIPLRLILILLAFLCCGCWKTKINCLAFLPNPRRILPTRTVFEREAQQEQSEGRSSCFRKAIEAREKILTPTSTSRRTMTKDSEHEGGRNNLFRIRTITAFVTFEDSDFEGGAEVLKSKIGGTARALQEARKQLQEGRGESESESECDHGNSGYEIQTVRIATNPFPEYLLGSNNDNDSNGVFRDRLSVLDECLGKHEIAFVSLGPASCPETAKLCTEIVGVPSGRFSASVQLQANDCALARAAAQTVLDNSKLGNPEDGGLANFRFCVANLGPYVPFFPGAKAASSNGNEAFRIRIAVGLENGGLLKDLLTKDAGQTIANILPPQSEAASGSSIGSSFAAGFADAVRPIQTICERVANEWNDDSSSSSTPLEYIGLDASFNPSLDEEGSVAAAVEVLREVPMGFGGVGTVAATAAMTTAIQTKLPSDFGIKITGYNGLMLPLCEDQRLAELASEGKLKIRDLLNVSSVCGVGIDTVPIPGNTNVDELASLLLDVAGLAERWNKPLSCRVFPVPNKIVGDMTTFDSPFLVNSKVLPLS